MGTNYVNAISGRLSLRPPQRTSLEILSPVCESVPLKKDGDVKAALWLAQKETNVQKMHIAGSDKPVSFYRGKNP